MHEAHAVAAAIEHGLLEGPPDRGRWRLVVRDPVRADAGFVRFYATELLRQRGAPDGVRVEVSVRAVRCGDCGAQVRPTPTDPVCPRCGTPIPPIGGPAIEVAPSRVDRCA
jgi:hypothetical protein